MTGLLQDIRFGVRTLARSPGFTAAAILSLALGIGANTAIFSLIDAVMLKPLPVEDPERLVILGPGRSRGISTSDTPIIRLFSYPRYKKLAAGNDVLSDLAAFGSGTFSAYLLQEGPGNSVAVRTALVSGNYFRTFGLQPRLGRLIEPTDEAALGAEPVAVLSHSFWVSHFGSEPNAVGRTLVLNEHPYSVIGVAPRGFNGERVGAGVDVWVPLTMQREVTRRETLLDDPQISFMHLMGRLGPGVSIAQAEASLDVLWEQVLRAEPNDVPQEDWERAMAASRMTLRSGARGYSNLDDFHGPLTLLIAVSALVLLIACANIANLLLARASSRRKEIGVRLALGAGRGRLVRQLLTESLMLSLAGGVLGLVAAGWGRDALVALVDSGGMSENLDLAIRGRTLGFNFAVAVTTGLLFGLAPAFRAGKAGLVGALQGQGRGTVEGARTGPQRLLVAGQAALSVVLLSGAGLFLLSLSTMRSAEMGFDADRLLSFELDMRNAGYQTSELGAVYRRLIDQVEAVPGVESAILVASPAITNSRRSRTAEIEGYEPTPDEDMDVTIVHVTPGYLAATGVVLREGRMLDERDREGGPATAVVDSVFARRFFPQTSPIGGRMRMESRWVEIVGVVEQSRYFGIHAPDYPMAYLSVYSEPIHLGGLMVRTAGDPGALSSEVRATIEAAAPGLPIRGVSTVTERVEDDLRYERLLALLTVFFGILAALLAAVGLFGVMSYAVSRRTNEFGVRKALGAQAADLLRLMLRESILVTVAGSVVGLFAALALGPAVAGLLYRTAPGDPRVLFGSVALLLVVGVVAGLPAAVRAARMNPQEALRHQ